MNNSRWHQSALTFTVTQMGAFARELRQACRSLLNRKVYLLTCAGTLALVLGANTAMFAVANATMLRPLPFHTQGRVVHLYGQPPGTTTALQRNPLQQMEVPRLRERARTLAQLEGFYQYERVVTLDGDPRVVMGATITPGLLTMLSVPVEHGRAFRKDEEYPGHHVALITHRYWRESLSGRPVLGESLVLDDQPYTIVGVLAPSFAVPFIQADVLTPLVSSPEPVRAPQRTFVALAELAPGVSIERAREELISISEQLSQEFPRTHAFWTIGVEDVREWQYGNMKVPLLMLLAASGFVLLIACVNIANLASAHAAARSGELALRLALGASKRDVLLLHLAELLILATVGLIAGLLIARAAVPPLLGINPTIARSLGDVSIDWRVRTFSAIVAMFAAVLASAIPALRAMRGDAAAILRASTTRATGSANAVRVQRALVSIEVALCVALLMASAVVIQGLRDLSRRGPGYESAGVLTAQIRLTETAYRSHESRTAVVKRLLDAVRVLPGVESAGITQNIFTPKFSYQTLIKVKDIPTPDDQPHTVQYRRISPDYFRAMRIKTLAGRVFTDADVAGRLPVALISRAFAERLMPGVDPIGRLLVRNNPPPVTIVGVVDDASDVTAAEQAEPTFYVPWDQNSAFGVPVALVIRTSVVPSSLIPAVREALKRVDASLPLRKPQPLEVFVRESTAPERFRLSLLSIIAGLGLVLATLGIAAVTYRTVIDRTKDFAVRLALGSGSSAVIRLVVRDTLRDISYGLGGGLATGTAACLLLASYIENVSRVDINTVAATFGIVIAAGLTAAFFPALRITRVNPAAVLRS